MPFKTKNRLDQNWWGIERKVGRFLGSPKADVMLVQTLLNAIQQTENGGVFVVWSVPPPSDPLVVDGFCGPITNNWILWFQQAQALYRDGIVDPSSRPWTIPPSVVIEEAACPARYTPSHSSINCSHWRSRCGTCSLIRKDELTRSCAPR